MERVSNVFKFLFIGYSQKYFKQINASMARKIEDNMGSNFEDYN